MCDPDFLLVVITEDVIEAVVLYHQAELNHLNAVNIPDKQSLFAFGLKACSFDIFCEFMRVIQPHKSGRSSEKCLRFSSAYFFFFVPFKEIFFNNFSTFDEIRNNSWYCIILKNDFGRENSRNSGFSVRHKLSIDNMNRRAYDYSIMARFL